MKFRELIEGKKDFVYMSKNIEDFNQEVTGEDSISEFEDLMNNIEKVIGSKNWSYSKTGANNEITFTVNQDKQKKFFSVAKSFGLDIK